MDTSSLSPAAASAHSMISGMFIAPTLSNTGTGTNSPSSAPSVSRSLSQTMAPSQSTSPAPSASGTAAASATTSGTAPATLSSAPSLSATASGTAPPTLFSAASLSASVKTPIIAVAPAEIDTAAAREASSACGMVYSDRLVFHPPATPRICSPRELVSAVMAGGRRGHDQPFHVGGACSNFRWFDSVHSCALLERAGMLQLMGDSLTRHLSQALLTILSGNYSHATAIQGNPADEGYTECVCDTAYDEGHRPDGNMDDVNKPKTRYCRQHTAAVFGAVSLPELRRRLPGFCPLWTRHHACFNYCPDMPDRGFTYMNAGLHYPNLTQWTVDNTYGVRGANLAYTGYEGGAPPGYRLICGSLHAPGSGKPVAYLRSHGMEATIHYNALIRESAVCNAPGEAYFDSFAATLNSTSIDGQHYRQPENLIVAQLLLNLVAAMLEEEKPG